MTKARDLANIISGGFTADDIPNLDASKIVSGDISAARLSLATETKPVVSSVSPSVISNDATDIVITGTGTLTLPASVKVISGTYDGSVGNLIQIVSTNGATEQWASISQQAV